MEPRAPSFRYGAVLVCATAALVFLIVAPTTDWARAVAFALEGLALAIAVATAATRPQVQRARAALVGGAAALLVAMVAAGVVPPEVAAALSALAGTGASLALVGGLIRLVRRHGVTLQAVAGALAIYVQLGLIFAWLIGFVTYVSSAPYFAQAGTARSRTGCTSASRSSRPRGSATSRPDSPSAAGSRWSRCSPASCIWSR